MLTVNNLILRVEGLEEIPHNELEQVGNPNLKIWIKDYDVWFNDGNDIFALINNAAKIASEIKKGRKFIHIELQNEGIPFLIDSSILKIIADSGCNLEIYVDNAMEEE